MPPVDAPPPREPEIELLARAARLTLVGLRVAFWIAGAVAVCVGLARILVPTSPDALATADASSNVEQAQHFVWLCAGLPLVAPVNWLFGRGRWWALAVAVLLWLVPMWLPGDHRYGYVLRVFATIVACASLVVWRTLWRLTPAPTPG